MFIKKLHIQLLPWLLLLPLFVSAQKIQIEGEVKEAKNNTTVPYASVSLYNAASDELPIVGTYTQENGRFVLEKLSAGTYTLKIQLLGYNTVTQNITLTSTNNKVNLGTILLTENVEELETVIVKAEKALVENKFEKEVINVSKDNRVATASLPLILENSANITIDPLKGLTINGDANIKILINGVWRGEESGAEVLSRLNPMNVEKVEIITNPASRYGSDGTAGIINIIMKKNEAFKKYFGVNARVATLPNRGINVNLGTFTKKLGFHGTYSYDFFKQESTSNTDTRDLLADVLTVQKNNIEQRNHTHQALFGVNYAITDATNINAQVEYANSKIKNLQTIGFRYEYPTEVINNQWDTDGDYGVETVNYTLDVSHTTKKEAFINFSFNYLNGDFTKDYFITENQTNNTLIRGNDDRNNGEFRFLYESPQLNKIKYEIGTAYNFRFLNYELGEDELGGSVIDISNLKWAYDEKIASFFTDVYYTHNDWKVRIGGRLENTDIAAAAGNADQSYLKFFPSVQLDRKLKGSHRISLGYSRRINRPRPHQVNNIPSITDPNNIRQGNPALQPELSHNINFRYQAKIAGISTVISPFYKYIKDAIQLIARVDEEITVTAYENVNSIENVGVSMNFRFKPVKKWSASFTFNPFFTKLRDETVGNEGFNYSFRFNNTLQLPADFTFGAYYYYYGEQNILQGIIEPIHQFDLTLNKSFPKSNLDISFEIQDLFNTRQVGIQANDNTFDRNIIRNPKSSYLIFGITYKPKLVSKQSKRLSRSKIYSKEEIE